jgi:hypothetical protein
VKLCKDCKYFTYNWITGLACGQCHHPAVVADNRDSMVTGGSSEYASIARSSGPCGKRAELFEAKA